MRVKTTQSDRFFHVSWAYLKGFIVAHTARRSFQLPWEDSIVRKVLPGFM